MDTHVYLMGTVIQEQHGSGNKPTGVGVGVGELIVSVENKITWVLTDFTQAWIRAIRSKKSQERSVTPAP